LLIVELLIYIIYYYLYKLIVLQSTTLYTGNSYIID
jgi:hypothetical protein